MARKRHPRLTARTADRHRLYSQSVQSVDKEIAFINRIFRRHYHRPPVLLREDFCGTALISCDWVKANTRNRALAVDLDPEPLTYCRRHYLPALKSDQARRLRLIQANVLSVRTAPVDVIAALNFSFCVFKQRSLLLRYLRRCHAALKPRGLMVMDIYGGPESHQITQDKTRYDGFTYVWHQAAFNPITNEALNHIHFLFPDGSRMRKAFTYDWRLWTPVEITEALAEAGFRNTQVYWEGATDDGKGNGVFRQCQRVPQEPAWVAYIVGQR